MTVREEIIKTVATTDDLQLLCDILDFIATRQADPNRPPRRSQADFARFVGSISDEEAQEMYDITNREFNSFATGGHTI